MAHSHNRRTDRAVLRHGPRKKPRLASCSQCREHFAFILHGSGTRLAVVLRVTAEHSSWTARLPQVARTCSLRSLHPQHQERGPRSEDNGARARKAYPTLMLTAALRQLMTGARACCSCSCTVKNARLFCTALTSTSATTLLSSWQLCGRARVCTIVEEGVPTGQHPLLRPFFGSFRKVRLFVEGKMGIAFCLGSGAGGTSGRRRRIARVGHVWASD